MSQVRPIFAGSFLSYATAPNGIREFLIPTTDTEFLTSATISSHSSRVKPRLKIERHTSSMPFGLQFKPLADPSLSSLRLFIPCLQITERVCERGQLGPPTLHGRISGSLNAKHFFRSSRGTTSLIPARMMQDLLLAPVELREMGSDQNSIPICAIHAFPAYAWLR